DTGQTLVVTAVSSNPALIPNPTISYTSGNSAGSLSFTPTTGASGTATITVTVTDSGGVANNGVNSVSQSFQVIVGSPAVPPAPGSIASTTILANSGLQTVNLTGITGGSSDPTGQNLAVTAISSNPALIPNPTVTYTAPGNSGTLTYTPTAGATGSATI